MTIEQKNSNRQEDFWGNFLGNLPQLSWNNAFCGQLGLRGSYWVQETATIESIERYLSLSVTTNHITHFASPSPGFCFRRFMATIRSCMPDTMLQQTWTPHKLLSECAQITHSTPSIFTLLVKKAFLLGGGDSLRTQTVCQVHLRFCLNGSTSKGNSGPNRSTLTNHCQSKERGYFPVVARITMMFSLE